MEPQRGTITLDNYDTWKHRWERRCLPYRRITVHSSLSSAQVTRQLCERILPPKWYISAGLLENSKGPDIRGVVEGERVTLSPRHLTTKTWLIPVAKGVIQSLPDGSSAVKIHVRPHMLYFSCFSAIMFLLVGLMVAAPISWAATGFSSWPLWSRIEVAIVYPLAACAFKLQVRAFFEDGAVLPVLFSALGDVRFDE